MRIVVMGAGGTGGFFGGLLARAGEDVTFVARGAHLEALRDRGLTVKSRLAGDFTLPLPVTDDPTELDPPDLILFCVKAYDTVPAAEQIAPLVAEGTLLLSLQNGVDNEERIAGVVGKDAVLGALAYVSSVIEAPGVVAQRGGPGRIVFGELEGGSSPRTRRLLRTLQRAGIAAELHPDIQVALWEKFVFICGVNGVTALTRLPIGAILAHPESRELLRSTMEEAEGVGRATGVRLPEDLLDQHFRFLATLEPSVRGSMYYDLEAGRRLELEALNGTAVRLGREHGIPTPSNWAIYTALKPYADGAPATS